MNKRRGAIEIVLWFNPAGGQAPHSCSLTPPQRDGEENWKKVKLVG